MHEYDPITASHKHRTHSGIELMLRVAFTYGSDLTLNLGEVYN